MWHPRVGRATGFSMIELTLVVAISSIVVVGLSSIIEVPQLVVEEQQAGRVSRADSALAVLDRDVRYARSVSLVDSRTLDITSATGTSIRYGWAGTPGRALMRREGAQGGEVLPNIQSLVFELEMADLPGAVPDQAVTSATLGAAQWSTFTLQPGYALGVTAAGVRGAGAGGGAGVNGVTSTAVAAQTQSFTVTLANRAGIGFSASLPTLPSGEAGTPSVLRCRLRRGGGADLMVRVFEATGRSAPQYLSWVATGWVRNYDLPLTFAEVSIPLTAYQKVAHGRSYFIQLVSGGIGASADIEYQTLSVAAAAAASGTAFVTSADLGITYASPAGALDAAQAPFTLDVIASEPVGASGGSTAEIATGVRIRLDMQTGRGIEVLRVSLPIINNIARLSR